MRPVSEGLLLAVTGATATVAGLFLVGVFLYVETALRRPDQGDRGALRRYMRSATRIVLALFAIPLLLPLALVAFDLPWARAIYAVLCVLLLAANVDSVRRIRALPRTDGFRTLLVNEVAGSVGVLAIVVLPWALGASVEALTLGALIAFATGFASVATMALSIFDLLRADGS